MNIAEINLSRRQANVSARECLNIILANIDTLRLKDRHGKMEKAVKEFHVMMERGQSLTPNQLSYIDSIYERVMKCAGFESCKLHISKKKRGLRYG